MADWTTIASLATAVGTLGLAASTLTSVRAANRSAEATERMVLASLRPLLVTARADDPPQKVVWVDRHAVKLSAGRGSAEDVDGLVYLAISLRNTGAGIAVLHGWNLLCDDDPMLPHHDPDEYRRQTRDIYIAPSDIGFWQGAIREVDDPDLARVRQAIKSREVLTVDLLYGDQEGGQRTITRFRMIPIETGDEWICAAARHWNLDRPDPR